jgi:hypothetical protein
MSFWSTETFAVRVAHFLCNVATVQARISHRCLRGNAMSRGLDIDRGEERTTSSWYGAAPTRSARIEPTRDPARDPTRRSTSLPSAQFRLPGGPGRSDLLTRGGHFRLRDTESHTLVSVGTFRVVFERDLLEGPYHGDAARLGQDVRSLRAQHLLDRRTIASDDSGHMMGILALTEHGADLLRGAARPRGRRARPRGVPRLAQARRDHS